MKIYKNPQGHFPERLHFTNDEIDDMCVQALEQVEELPDEPKPIRIDRFIEKHFDTKVCYEVPFENVLGFTLFNKNGSIRLVGVSPALEDGTTVGERRIRSTFAHEGGHCLMHPILFMDTASQSSNYSDGNLDIKERRILCRKEHISVKKYDGRWWEYQANRAIGGFLLPRKLVDVVMEKFLSETDKMLKPEFLDQAKRELTELFDVNPIVAQIRIEEFYMSK